MVHTNPWLCFRTLIFMIIAYPRCMASSLRDSKFDDNDPLLVKTTKGYVRGVTLESETFKDVDAFLGIPFAKPPVGKLRFRSPEPADPWTEVFNATDKPNACCQLNDTSFGEFEGTKVWTPNTPTSEDCLKINVWVPRPRPSKAAVMVWIYGGGFQSGSSSLDMYDAKIMVSEKKIIVVSMNYRVDVLGFLYLGIPDAPGNVGLLDQVMALQWVQDNIERFGGDPQKVTIFGESAGAGSVTFHLLSPLSRNLFSQAAFQSGSALAPWAIADKSKVKENALKLAKLLKCPSDENDLQAVVNCMRKKDASEIISNGLKTTAIIDFCFSPITDGTFIVEHPSISMRTKNFKETKILAGTNSEEGTIFALHYLPNYLNIKEGVHLTQDDLKTCVRKLCPDVKELGQEAIIYEYTDWFKPNDSISNLKAVDKIIGDYYFTCSTNEFCHYYAETGNDVYQYLFAHKASVSPWPKWTGVLHGDEINFVFGHPLDIKLGYEESEKELSKKMMSYWTNFAKTGNPNINELGERESINWPRHTTDEKEYLTFANNFEVVGHGLRSRQCVFWNNFLPRILEFEGGHLPLAQ